MDDQNNMRSSSQTNKFSTGQAGTKRFSKVEEPVLAKTYKSDQFTNMSVKLKTPWSKIYETKCKL